MQPRYYVEPGAKLSQLPILVRDDALVISDNADIYGTVSDVLAREIGAA